MATARNIISETHIDRLGRAVLKLARIIEQDARALPIFERLDAEFTAAQAMLKVSKVADPIAKARAMAKLKREME